MNNTIKNNRLEIENKTVLDAEMFLEAEVAIDKIPFPWAHDGSFNKLEDDNYEDRIMPEQVLEDLCHDISRASDHPVRDILEQKARKFADLFGLNTSEIDIALEKYGGMYFQPDSFWDSNNDFDPRDAYCPEEQFEKDRLVQTELS